MSYSLTTQALIRISLLLSLFLSTMLYGSPALASELDDAKDRGVVGERADGYLGFVVEPVAAAVHALVTDINDKRNAQYRIIAQQNGLTLAEVEALAGKKIYEKTASGGWYYKSSWQQKP